MGFEDRATRKATGLGKVGRPPGLEAGRLHGPAQLDVPGRRLGIPTAGQPYCQQQRQPASPHASQELSSPACLKSKTQDP